MTNYNLTIYKDISRMLTVTLVYLLIFITVQFFYEKQLIKPYYLIGIPVILLCYLLIQRYCFQPILYLLLHSIFYIPVLLISFPNNYYLVLYIGMLLLENSHAIYIWKHSSDRPYDELPWYLFFFVTILYIGVKAAHQDSLADYVYYIGLALLLLHFVRYFIHGLGILFSHAEHTTTMPTKKILLTNLTLLGFLLFFLAAFSLIAHLFHLDEFLYIVGDFLVKLFQVLIKFLLYIIAFLRLIFSSDSSVSDTSEASDALSEALKDMPEPSMYAQIIMVMIELAMAFFVLYVIYRLISHFIQLFLKRYAADSDLVVPLQDKKEQIFTKKEKLSILSGIKELFDTSITAKIRRIYRTKIKNYKEVEIKKNDTPTDIANNIFIVYDEDIHMLTQVYEKARYSNEEITVDDAKKGGIL